MYNWQSDIISLSKNYRANEYRIIMELTDYEKFLQSKIYKYITNAMAGDGNEYPARFYLLTAKNIINQIANDVDKKTGLIEYTPLYNKKNKRYRYLFKDVRRSGNLHFTIVNLFQLITAARKHNHKIFESREYRKYM